MKKPFLLVLMLSISSHASASDLTQLSSKLVLGSTADESGELCMSIRKFYAPMESTCIKVNAPLYIVKQNLEATLSIYKQAKLLDSIIYKYSFGDVEFNLESGGFYQASLLSDAKAGEPKIIRLVLDPVSKYSTSIVFY